MIEVRSSWTVVDGNIYRAGFEPRHVVQCELDRREPWRQAIRARIAARSGR